MRFTLSLLLLLLVLAPSFSKAQAPVADFTANFTTGCAPLSVSFTDKSTGNPQSWNWDFGNGQLSNRQNPDVAFAVGTYTVTLVVRNANGINQVTKTGYITVNPSPTVKFVSNLNLACLPATVQFTDQSVANAGTINKWEWHFNDGGPNIDAQNPSHTYANPGFYDVYLKVTSSAGCAAAVNLPRYIRVVNGVKADFNAIGPATCTAPYTMTYKNLTSGPGNLTYTWDLGNSTTSTATDPPATYPTANTYTVKLKAQSEFGCADSIQKNISVKGVTSTFTSTPDSVCFGSPISFQSTTTPAPVKVAWDFADGTFSDQLKPPAKTYTVAGTYPVKLISNFGNCSDTLIRVVKVKDKPVVDFTAPKFRTCKPNLVVNFQNLSPDAKTASWDFGDGTTGTGLNPSHTYTKSGVFDVKLTITDGTGCSNTITKKDFVVILGTFVGIANEHDGVCVGQPYQPKETVSAAEGVASFAWNFGDGSPIDNSQTPSHTYSIPGYYNVTLSIVSVDGCPDSKTFPNAVQVGLHSVVDFSADNLLPCRSDSVSFTNLSVPPGQKWLWSFGDTSTSTLQNPRHKYNGTGLFNVKLRVTNDGCSDSLTKSNYINALPPKADFGYIIPDCNNKNTVLFTDSSETDPGLPPLTYQWNFGDGAGTSAAVGNAGYTYAGPAVNATYPVKLIVENGVCHDTITKTIQLVNEKADFTFNGAPVFCRKNRVKFTSTNNLALIKNYEWVIDGVRETGQNEYNTSFAVSGAHSVYLVITDINGCKDSTLPTPFTVTGPTAALNIGTNGGGCKGSPIQFTDASIPAVGVISSWSYDFGDGSPLSAQQNPTHNYADTGVYRIKFTVTDDMNCFDTIDTTAYISKPRPFFSTAQTTFCPGTPLPFRDSSFGRGLQYTWYLGDGTTDNVQNPQHIYPPNDSVYTVKLVVRDTVGCMDSLTRTNYITTKRPKSVYTAKDTAALCAPLESKFTFKGQDYESFSWDFGDGGTSTLANTSHFYNATGNYVTKLYTVGFGGCIDSVSIPISVLDPATASSLTYTPSPAIACNELTVNFSVSTPSFTAYKVYFGDGAADSTKQPTFDHFYSSPGSYSPYIFLTDSTGCQANVGGASGTVQILGAVPLFGMDKNKFCDTGIVYFSDYSQDGVDRIVSRSWSFGDGTPAGPLPPAASHVYTQPGLYFPSLSVTTVANCTQVFTDTVRILATPQPVITSFDGVCNDRVIDFAGTLRVPPDTAITWKWTLGEGQTSGLQNVTVKYADTGLHKITLEASNSLNCKGTTTKDITVFPLPTIRVAGDTSIVAGGAGLTIPMIYSTNTVSYNWTPPTNLSCTDCATPFASPKFTTTYKVNTADANGCKNSRSITLQVFCNDKNFFMPNTFSPNNDGANDRFYPRGTGLDRIQALRIFNRWGEMVFEKRNFPANDAASGWDGSYKGKTAATDTYIYMIDIICANANIITTKGSVTLIR